MRSLDKSRAVPAAQQGSHQQQQKHSALPPQPATHRSLDACSTATAVPPSACWRGAACCLGCNGGTRGSGAAALPAVPNRRRHCWHGALQQVQLRQCRMRCRQHECHAATQASTGMGATAQQRPFYPTSAPEHGCAVPPPCMPARCAATLQSGRQLGWLSASVGPAAAPAAVPVPPAAAPVPPAASSVLQASAPAPPRPPAPALQVRPRECCLQP